MSVGYLDSSCLVAVALGEPIDDSVSTLLGEVDDLYASALAEAELRSALAREDVLDRADQALSGISWVLPDRPLSTEIDRVLSVGYLRGADLWHVACALYLSPNAGELVFISLDRAQSNVAASLGFRTTPLP